ncbi:recombinase family protein [Bradyrhizobium sp. 2TAF36]|uniref:recombinase family protein n=1 Tax=Bradyrhizobium sp. 2TAF36 TaxID=3233016 RepID=UPI003F8FEB7A
MERIRDKIAASKRKGLWVGGPLPLGYALSDGKLKPVEEEAERVRLIFRRYLEVASINELVRDLKDRQICTKARALRTGRSRGGIPFGRGTLSHLLRNRFFIGEVNYRGEILPGEQPAILDRELFEAVQRKLSAQQGHTTLSRRKSNHLLRDLLYDDAGHVMTATHATKAGVRYRYYVSRPSLHGEARTADVGSVSRVPAQEIESTVVQALREHIADEDLVSSNRIHLSGFDRDRLENLVARIQVHRTQLVLSLKPTDRSSNMITLSVPWQKPASKRSRKILLPARAERKQIRPERAERRVRLVAAIARGRRWLEEITASAVKSSEELAKRERCTTRQINLTLSLAFLAPSLVRAAIEGRLPRGVNIERLRDPDPDWDVQFQTLGLDPN